MISSVIRRTSRQHSRKLLSLYVNLWNVRLFFTIVCKLSENRGARLHGAVVNTFAAGDAQLVVEDDFASLQISNMQSPYFAMGYAVSTMVAETFIPYDAFFDRADGDAKRRDIFHGLCDGSGFAFDIQHQIAFAFACHTCTEDVHFQIEIFYQFIDNRRVRFADWEMQEIFLCDNHDDLRPPPLLFLDVQWLHALFNRQLGQRLRQQERAVLNLGLQYLADFQGFVIR